jgi:hypothetical protein
MTTVFYSHPMLNFSVCLVAAVVAGFALASLLEPLDYNWYIRELKLNIPDVPENFPAMRSGEPDLRTHSTTIPFPCAGISRAREMRGVRGKLRIMLQIFSASGRERTRVLPDWLRQK